jgi:hypothetical protein
MTTPFRQMREVGIVIGSAELQADHSELFHYTRAAGFESIIRSNTLWATLFRDLKDQQEIKVLKPQLTTTILELFDKAVARRGRSVRRRFEHFGGARFQANKFVASIYKSTFERSDPRFAVDAFTTSFTTHAADSQFERENGLPSQWTEYAPDGFCIVLDTAEMCRLLGLEFDKRDFTHLNLEPVRYAFEAVPLRVHFPDLEPALISSIEQFLDHVHNPEMAMIQFLQSATLLKETKYKEEREVRIVAIPGAPGYQAQAAREYPHFVAKPLPKIEPHPNGSGSRHLTIFDDLGIELPIKRVIVGPSAHQASNAALARDLVDADRVTLSQLPLPALRNTG